MTRLTITLSDERPRALKEAAAKGMSQVAHDTGLSRESLYKALSGERSPSFDTSLKVIQALGLKLHAEAAPLVGTKAQAEAVQRNTGARRGA